MGAQDPLPATWRPLRVTADLGGSTRSLTEIAVRRVCTNFREASESRFVLRGGGQQDDAGAGIMI